MITISFCAILILLFIPFLIFLKRKKGKKVTFIKGTRSKQKVNKIINFEIVASEQDLLCLVNKILTNNILKIGIDIEYYKGDKYTGEICLIQITLPNKESFILDMILIEKNANVRYLLKKLLENQKIEKVIHSSENDLDWIYDGLQISTVNIFDTQEAEQFIDKSKKRTGLDNLLKKYSLCDMDKSYKKFYQQSNWKERPLTEDQVIYAAQDSYYLIDLSERQSKKIGCQLKIFKEKLNEKIQCKYGKSFLERLSIKAINYFNSNYVKYNPFIYEVSSSVMIALFKLNDNLAKKLDKNSEKVMKQKLIYRIATVLPEDLGKLKDLFMQEKVEYDKTKFDIIIEIIEKIKAEKVNSLTEEELKTVSECVKTNQGTNQESKKPNINDIIKRFSCKKPVYESCQMLAPDGQLLCYCDSKKMNWYIVKNLADLVSSDPPVFKLKFEPNERGCSDLNGIPSDFYVRYRKNCCVVCGREEDYMRFHVVPLLYRQFFPNELKSHKSHDVILLCFICMEKANRLYEINKKNLSEKYNVPMMVLTEKQKDIKLLQKAIVAAKHIYNHFEVIPLKSKNILGKDLMDFIKIEENKQKFPYFYSEIFLGKEIPKDINSFTKDTLSLIKSYKIKEFTSEEKKNFHGKMIVDKIDDFQSFIRSWRNYFIESLQPKFLPDAWNVDHQFYRTFGEHSKFKEGLTAPIKVDKKIE